MIHNFIYCNININGACAEEPGYRWRHRLSHQLFRIFDFDYFLSHSADSTGNPEHIIQSFSNATLCPTPIWFLLATSFAYHIHVYYCTFDTYTDSLCESFRRLPALHWRSVAKKHFFKWQNEWQSKVVCVCVCFVAHIACLLNCNMMWYDSRLNKIYDFFYRHGVILCLLIGTTYFWNVENVLDSRYVRRYIVADFCSFFACSNENL